jgi:hypothetical protein
VDAQPNTEQVDVRAFFEAQQAAAALSESRAPAAPPAPPDPVTADPQGVSARAPEAAGDEPATGEMELGNADAVEARVMDDDAFFASLRDAVRDNEPLGPRDEGGSALFDQDDDDDPDRAGFREMFRRRR